MEKRIRLAMTRAFNSSVSDAAKLTNLGGHASLRIYWRIEFSSVLSSVFSNSISNSISNILKNDQSLIAMVLPQDQSALKSDEGGSSKDPKPTELPFVTVQRYLKDLGIRVPEIVAIDMDLGVLLLEDLGTTMFENRVLDEPENTEIFYREAIDLLVDFQNKSMSEEEKTCPCWSKSFDSELLKWELDHYIEWGVDALHEEDFFEGIRPDISERFDSLVYQLTTLPQALVFRDYQSRNIMWKNNEWVAIDFQDALRGPYIYDLVALLRDSYIELPPAMVSRLVDYYAAQDLPWQRTQEEMHLDFHRQTLQRKLKDTGRFIFIDKVKKNDSFLQYYKPSLAYVQNSLQNLPLKDDPIWNRIVQNG